MNRVWLITGASSGFGRAITEAAVAADDTVVATARNKEVLSDIAAAHPGQVEALALDVTDAAAIEAAVQDVITRHGRIDVLVNNAGRGHVGAAEETSDAELRSLFDVHVFGPGGLDPGGAAVHAGTPFWGDRANQQHGRAAFFRRVLGLQRD